MGEVVRSDGGWESKPQGTVPVWADSAWISIEEEEAGGTC